MSAKLAAFIYAGRAPAQQLSGHRLLALVHGSFRAWPSCSGRRGVTHSPRGTHSAHSAACTSRAPLHSHGRPFTHAHLICAVSICMLSYTPCSVFTGSMLRPGGDRAATIAGAAQIAGCCLFLAAAPVGCIGAAQGVDDGPQHEEGQPAAHEAGDEGARDQAAVAREQRGGVELCQVVCNPAQPCSARGAVW